MTTKTLPSPYMWALTHNCMNSRTWRSCSLVTRQNLPSSLPVATPQKAVQSSFGIDNAQTFLLIKVHNFSSYLPIIPSNISSHILYLHMIIFFPFFSRIYNSSQGFEWIPSIARYLWNDESRQEGDSAKRRGDVRSIRITRAVGLNAG